MSASSLAQVLLRLIALKWIVEGVAHLISAIASSASMGRLHVFGYAATVACFVCGVVVWFVAPRLSHLIVGKLDQEREGRGVTLRQLFATAILGLGLWFALETFGSVFNWVHYFATTETMSWRIHPDDQASLYDLTDTLLTFSAGVFLIFTARIWARKLCPEEQAGVSSGVAGEGEESSRTE